MSKYVLYFDNDEDSESYVITGLPFSCYIKETNKAIFSYNPGKINHGVVDTSSVFKYKCKSYNWKVPKSAFSNAGDILEYITLSPLTMAAITATPILGITNYAFQNNSLITSVELPSKVTSIGSDAFSNCSSLTSVTIPNSVTSIGNYAFLWCKSLTSVTIPNSVTSIGTWAFYGCTSLTSVTIGNSVTSIENNTFDGCSSLTSITIPNSVTSIGFEAFRDCTSLTSITIPNSVTSIGNSAFYNCSSLQSITCEAVIPPTLGSYNINPSVSIVYVPAGSIDAYKAKFNWSSYSSKIQAIP